MDKTCRVKWKTKCWAGPAGDSGISNEGEGIPGRGHGQIQEAE